MNPSSRGLMSIRHQSGFSLLEVLVEFSILALSLGVLLQVFSTGSRGAAASERYSMALMLAESKLAEAGRVSRDDIEGSGEFGDVFHWKVTAQPYEEDIFGDINTRLMAFEVAVEVSWVEGERRPAVTLEGLRVLPKR